MKKICTTMKTSFNQNAIDHFRKTFLYTLWKKELCLFSVNKVVWTLNGNSDW